MSQSPPTSTGTHTRSTKPVIGLVGGVGSGKSTVARMFAELGAAVIDSDRLGHEQLQRPEVLSQLRSWWGPQVVTAAGVADRSAISRIVFHDAAELSRLEALLHPLIDQRRKELVADLERDPAIKAVVLDAPKLLEAGLSGVCDRVVFVDSPRDERLRRVAETRGWSEDELNRRENLQFSLDKKRSMSDDVIVNHSDIEALRREVEQVFSAILNKVG